MILKPLSDTSVMKDMIALIRLGPTKGFTGLVFTQANGTFLFALKLPHRRFSGSDGTRKQTS
jgi:hypothetical protein